MRLSLSALNHHCRDEFCSRGARLLPARWWVFPPIRELIFVFFSVVFGKKGKSFILLVSKAAKRGWAQGGRRSGSRRWSPGFCQACHHCCGSSNCWRKMTVRPWRCWLWVPSYSGAQTAFSKVLSTVKLVMQPRKRNFKMRFICVFRSLVISDYVII